MTAGSKYFKVTEQVHKYVMVAVVLQLQSLYIIYIYKTQVLNKEE